MKKLDQELSNIDLNNKFVAQKLIKVQWEKFMTSFRTEFYNYRYDVTAFSYGQLGHQHFTYFSTVAINEQSTGFPPLFEDQIFEILDRVGKQKISGKNLVDRIKDKETAILGTLLSSVIFENMEFTDILGYKNKNGAYYQLARLTHNELRRLNDTATSYVNNYAPWTTKERINLSNSHPPINCICEDIAGGTYEIGEISLPLHPNCGCYKTPVTMSETEFLGLWNEEKWLEMDRYQKWLGVDRTAMMNPLLLIGAENILNNWLEKEVEVTNG